MKGGRSSVNIVSIVDEHSLVNAFVKVQSLLAYAQRPAQLHFAFLVFESPTFNHSVVQAVMTTQCFNLTPQQVTVRAWQAPRGLRDLLRHERFESELIFSRFYLPMLFPAFDRLLYLDNDVVVNCDVEDFYSLPLRTSASASALQAEDGRGVALPRGAQRAGQAVIGFVFERHAHYRDYLQHHFNLSNPFVRRKIGSVEGDVFLNAGVFLLDCKLWRAQAVTMEAEKVLARHHDPLLGPLFSTTAGDQGLFFLLLQGRMAFLPSRLNMRRLPRRSMTLLEQGQTGVVHFAGTLQGDQMLLCRYPLLHPVLWPAALPLYLTVVLSLQRKCPSLSPESWSLCREAVSQLLKTFQSHPVPVHFYEGPAHLLWPPQL
eukprot:gene7805-8616_t